MPEIIIILLAVILIIVILYLLNFKFEFKYTKEAKNVNGNQDKILLENLSNTEITILKLLAEGKTNKDISNSLSISVHTVKKHVSNIFKKLNLSSRSEARKYKSLIE